MNMANGSHGLVAIAAPFAVPFLQHPQAKYLNAMLLAYLVGLQPSLREVWAGADAADGVFKEMMRAISIGLGMYVLLAAADRQRAEVRAAAVG
jgi:hypothetical protein